MKYEVHKDKYVVWLVTENPSRLEKPIDVQVIQPEKRKAFSRNKAAIPFTLSKRGCAMLIEFLCSLAPFAGLTERKPRNYSEKIG